MVEAMVSSGDDQLETRLEQRLIELLGRLRFMGACLCSMSACLCSMSALSGCAIQAPPDLSDPVPERPNLNVFSANPLVTQVLIAESNQRINFNIPFTGDDGGERYIAQLWLDWGFEGARLVDQVAILPLSEAPLPDDQEEREVSLTWQLTGLISAGCHILTLQITPKSNVSDSLPFHPVESSLVASTTWWTNVDVHFAEQQTLKDCPSGPSTFANQ
ncbi:MAG: hypothetical protein MK135_17105 [Polyangiaceae bacterium]|nr:hypothetical protein [Polyangiaceae bacterium]